MVACVRKLADFYGLPEPRISNFRSLCLECFKVDNHFFLHRVWHRGGWDLANSPSNHVWVFFQNLRFLDLSLSHSRIALWGKYGRIGRYSVTVCLSPACWMKDRTVGNGLTAALYTMALEAGKTKAGSRQAVCWKACWSQAALLSLVDEVMPSILSMCP